MSIKRFQHASQNFERAQAAIDAYESNLRTWEEFNRQPEAEKDWASWSPPPLDHRFQFQCECARDDCDEVVELDAYSYWNDESRPENIFLVTKSHVTPLVDHLPVAREYVDGLVMVYSPSEQEREKLDVESLRLEYAAGRERVRDLDGGLEKVTARVQGIGPAAVVALGLFVAVRPEDAERWTFVFYMAAATVVLVVVGISLGVSRATSDRLSALREPFRMMSWVDWRAHEAEIENDLFARERVVSFLSIRQLEDVRAAQKLARSEYHLYLGQEEWLLLAIHSAKVDAAKLDRVVGLARRWENRARVLLYLAMLLIVADIVAAFFTAS